jgi:rod shape-determining protein MreC
MTGDNSAFPPLDYLETPGDIVPGDQVLSSGDGGVFPAGLPIGQVVKDVDGRLRVSLAADQDRLEFLRVIRSHTLEQISDAGALLAPGPMMGPQPVVAPVADGPPPPEAGPILDGTDG